jgi:putative aminopeptidase FrvX
MVLDKDYLKAITEIPSVGTACLPGINLLKARFGSQYSATYVSDGFCFFQKKGAGPEQLRVLFVAHIDEIGGCVYGAEERGARNEQPSTFASRCWGNHPKVFADAELQAFDYLSEDAADAFDVRGSVTGTVPDERLVIHGDNIRPYRTVFTFRTETTLDGDFIVGKALDPRVTTFAVMEAVRALDSPFVGAMIVMAEECAMDVARKGVQFLQRKAPNLALVANADVPWIENIGEGNLELPAIRVFEGRNFIDPAFGIRTAERLQSKGVKFHLSAAKSGSQTLLFTPLAHTLSIALPSDGIHSPKYRMSLTGAERCIDLLTAVGEGALDGSLLDPVRLA